CAGRPRGAPDDPPIVPRGGGGAPGGLGNGGGGGRKYAPGPPRQRRYPRRPWSAADTALLPGLCRSRPVPTQSACYPFSRNKRDSRRYRRLRLRPAPTRSLMPLQSLQRRLFSPSVDRVKPRIAAAVQQMQLVAAPELVPGP